MPLPSSLRLDDEVGRHRRHEELQKFSSDLAEIRSRLHELSKDTEYTHKPHRKKKGRRDKKHSSNNHEKHQAGATCGAGSNSDSISQNGNNHRNLCGATVGQYGAPTVSDGSQNFGARGSSDVTHGSLPPPVTVFDVTSPLSQKLAAARTQEMNPSVTDAANSAAYSTKGRMEAARVRGGGGLQAFSTPLREPAGAPRNPTSDSGTSATTSNKPHGAQGETSSTAATPTEIDSSVDRASNLPAQQLAGRSLNKVVILPPPRISYSATVGNSLGESAASAGGTASGFLGSFFRKKAPQHHDLPTYSLPPVRTSIPPAGVQGNASSIGNDNPIQPIAAPPGPQRGDWEASHGAVVCGEFIMTPGQPAPAPWEQRKAFLRDLPAGLDHTALPPIRVTRGDDQTNQRTTNGRPELTICSVMGGEREEEGRMGGCRPARRELEEGSEVDSVKVMPLPPSPRVVPPPPSPLILPASAGGAPGGTREEMEEGECIEHFPEGEHLEGEVGSSGTAPVLQGPPGAGGIQLNGEQGGMVPAHTSQVAGEQEGREGESNASTGSRKGSEECSVEGLEGGEVAVDVEAAMALLRQLRLVAVGAVATAEETGSSDSYQTDGSQAHTWGGSSQESAATGSSQGSGWCGSSEYVPRQYIASTGHYGWGEEKDRNGICVASEMRCGSMSASLSEGGYADSVRVIGDEATSAKGHVIKGRVVEIVSEEGCLDGAASASEVGSDRTNMVSAWLNGVGG